jgi:triosephosphate isomerase
MAERRPLVAGNWKMNGLRASLSELEAVIAGVGPLAAKCDLLVCPPATLIAMFAWKTNGTKVAIGAQDCHPSASGAHTGDLSAEMLKDAGASAVIVGHSGGARTTPRPARRCGRKEAAWRADCSRSSVSARPWPGAK